MMVSERWPSGAITWLASPCVWSFNADLEKNSGRRRQRPVHGIALAIVTTVSLPPKWYVQMHPPIDMQPAANMAILGLHIRDQLRRNPSSQGQPINTISKYKTKPTANSASRKPSRLSMGLGTSTPPGSSPNFPSSNGQLSARYTPKPSLPSLPNLWI